jgi:ABC-2 type transport system permease protein
MTAITIVAVINFFHVKDALKAGAQARGIDEDVYTMYLNLKIANNAGKTVESNQFGQSTEMQNKVMAGLTAAAKVLNMQPADLASDMAKLKTNDNALTAAMEASGIPKEAFVSMIDGQLAAKEITIDKGIDFNVKDFLMLNLGCLLLMFAIIER